jgi:spore coat protein A
MMQSNPTGVPLLDLEKLEKFVDALPIPAVIQPKGKRPNPDRPSESIPYYRLAMRQITAKVHRDVKPTRCWGFENTSPGPTIETRSSQPLLVEWATNCQRIFAYRSHHSWSRGGQMAVRAVTHLHGAKVRRKATRKIGWWENPALPLSESAGCAQLWYHDHALGITAERMRDSLETALCDGFEDGELAKGKYEIPLAD